MNKERPFSLKSLLFSCLDTLFILGIKRIFIHVPTHIKSYSKFIHQSINSFPLDACFPRDQFIISWIWMWDLKISNKRKNEKWSYKVVVGCQVFFLDRPSTSTRSIRSGVELLGMLHFVLQSPQSSPTKNQK